jgi:hypothetical protein
MMASNPQFSVKNISEGESPTSSVYCYITIITLLNSIVKPPSYETIIKMDESYPYK